MKLSGKKWRRKAGRYLLFVEKSPNAEPMDTMKKTWVGGIDLTKKYICMECSCQREPIWVKRGWLIIEIVMWLLYIIPGVIYSIWRRVRKQQVCPKCLSPGMVLTTSSRVMKVRQLISSVSGGATLSEESPVRMQKDPVKPSGSPALPVPPAKKTEKPRKNYQDVLKNSQRRGKIAKGQQGPLHFKLADNKKRKE